MEAIGIGSANYVLYAIVSIVRVIGPVSQPDIDLANGARSICIASRR